MREIQKEPPNVKILLGKGLFDIGGSEPLIFSLI